ncbi:hypothetical protein [Streptomyces sp. NPDC001787]|uniref:hypothetical protein n=1 Tax=Streptomyces sp. NPDC001787 TaxID=3154523 RepID=UPI0033236F82
MTVYFAFIPSRRLRPAESGPLEFAPNQAIPEWALKRRAAHRHGPTYYDGVNHTVPPSAKPTADFPDADSTACLLVWKRTASQAVPKHGEEPDEMWSLTPRGRVTRDTWSPTNTDTQHRPSPKEIHP